MMTRGRGVSIPPKSDDVIYEQPLTNMIHIILTTLRWGEAGQYGPPEPTAAAIEHVLAPRSIFSCHQRHIVIVNVIIALNHLQGNTKIDSHQSAQCTMRHLLFKDTQTNF